MSLSSPADPPEQLLAAARQIFGSGYDEARRYASLLASTAVERGLLGPRERDRMWARHLLNCAAVGELVPAGASVVDVGSGAGLPGIPLALARDDLQVTLVEPMARRCAFLMEAVAARGLAERVGIIRGRAPEVAQELPAMDVAVSRAVAPLGRLALWTMPLLAPGGVMLAIRGSGAVDELSEDRDSVISAGGRLCDVVRCRVGILPEPTTVVRVVRSTRRRLPRKASETRTGGRV